MTSNKFKLPSSPRGSMTNGDVTSISNDKILNQITENNNYSSTQWDKKTTLYSFGTSIVKRLENSGKQRTSETYALALRSLFNFIGNKDLLLRDINSELLEGYQAVLLKKGLKLNSISFYMRILRALYNKAVEYNIIEQEFPFRHVYTGIEKTVKRSILLKNLKELKKLDFNGDEKLDFARDIFMFSFYTRGMSFIDIAYLRKENVKYGIIEYRRQKTQKVLYIKIEKPIEEIIQKYEDHNSQFIFPIINLNGEDVTKQYRKALRKINYSLSKIGKILNIQIPLTTYVSRHSWASIAKNKNIPISVICESMGHESERTTQIYLSSLDTAVIDEANVIILKEFI